MLFFALSSESLVVLADFSKSSRTTWQRDDWETSDLSQARAYEPIYFQMIPTVIVYCHIPGCMTLCNWYTAIIEVTTKSSIFDGILIGNPHVL